MSPGLRLARLSVACAFILTLVAIPSPGAARTCEADINGQDNTLYTYHRRCMENISSPSVLAMADTLFDMAGRLEDERMQAVALSTMVDYYFYSGNEDSLRLSVDRVKDFARHANLPKYYYFAWGKRLVRFYVKNGKLNTAFIEVEKMLEQARADDDKDGLAGCYNALANIYKTRGMIQKAGESRLLEVELIENYELDRYNISIAWIDIAEYYQSLGEDEKALDAVGKASDAALISPHEIMCLNFYLHYYDQTGQTRKASGYLERMEKLFKEDRQLDNLRKTLYSARVNYYSATGRYADALQALDDYQREQVRSGEGGMVFYNLKTKAKIYLQSGDHRSAADNYEQYVAVNDSMTVVMAENSVGEFAAMLDVERLNRQKQDLELHSTEQRYRYIRNVVILLIICLGAVSLMLARWYRLGRRLARSREELLVKNDALVESRAEAMAAREQAELASGMKSVFLRNMTHEIRTPLNAIVGFSHLIAEASDPESEIHEYAGIIKDNNARLLKLIEQVLDLSDLDSGRTLKLAPTDIDECCENAIVHAGVYCKPGVELEMIPYRKPLKTQANGERVEQILHNLLQNACEATSEGKVTLACKLLKESSQIVFTVTDTGVGIPADMREEIFDRFVKLDEFKLGSGLGLSLSRLLARHMGGSLVVDENYADGARLVFTLPYVDN